MELDATTIEQGAAAIERATPTIEQGVAAIELDSEKCFHGT